MRDVFLKNILKGVNLRLEKIKSVFLTQKQEKIIPLEAPMKYSSKGTNQQLEYSSKGINQQKEHHCISQSVVQSCHS